MIHTKRNAMEDTRHDMTDYHGHKTMTNGSHVAFTKEEAEALWKAAECAKAKSAEDMPATSDALRVMQGGWSRLRDLGWKEGTYCPKDGTPFAIIQYGSTGIFEGWYIGDWPSGFVSCCDGVEHPKGILFKPLAELTEAERTKLEECMKSEREFPERTIHNLITSEQSN